MVYVNNQKFEYHMVVINILFQLLVIMKNENILKKNQKKNIISETIKRIIPNFKPFWTCIVCFPSNVPSLTISVNQNCTKNAKTKKLTIIIFPPIKYLFTHKITPAKTLNNDIDTKKGHGDGLTIWNKWLLLFCIINKIFVYIFLNFVLNFLY